MCVQVDFPLTMKAANRDASHLTEFLQSGPFSSNKWIRAIHDSFEHHRDHTH